MWYIYLPYVYIITHLNEAVNIVFTNYIIIISNKAFDGGIFISSWRDGL